MNIDIKLNLNDFKAVLGQKNDGVVTVDGNGKLVKTKFGSALRRAVTKMPTTDPQKNRAIREALALAVANSSEGRTLGRDAINNIRLKLGLAVEGGDRWLSIAERTIVVEADLSRKDIDDILARVQGRLPGHEKAGGRLGTMLRQDVQLFEKCGLYSADTDRPLAKGVLDLMRGGGRGVFSSADGMVKVIKNLSKGGLKAFGGFTKAELMRFAKDNFADITSFAFMRLYETAYADRENQKADGFEDWKTGTVFNPEKAFLSALRDLAASYARHENGLPPRSFRKLAALPPLSATPEQIRSALENPNLAGATNRLNAMKTVVDGLFPQHGDGKFSLTQLWRTRANEQLQFAFCRKLGEVIALQNGNLDAAIADISKTDAGQFLRLAPDLRARLGDDLFAKLGAALRKKAASQDFGGGEDAAMRLLDSVGAQLRGLFANVPASPEETLCAVLRDMQVSPEKTDEILQALKKDGAFDPAVMAHCNRLVTEQLKLNAQTLLLPAEAPRPSDANLQQAIQNLKDALAPTVTKLRDNGAERSALILRCDPGAVDPEGVDILPRKFDEKGEFSARIRAKVSLAVSVFSPATLQEAGIRFDPSPKMRNKLLFPSLENAPDNLFAAEMADSPERQEFMDELAKYESILDDLLAHVPFGELEVRSQYLATKMNVLEKEMLGGQPILLEALRDGLIGPDVDARSAEILANILASACADEGLAERSIDIDHMDLDSLKAEFELRLRCKESRSGEKTAARRIRESIGLKIQETREAIPFEPSEQFPTLEVYEQWIERQAYMGLFGQCSEYGKFNQTGFGTADMLTIRNLLQECRIDIANLGKPFKLDDSGKPVPPDLDRLMGLLRLIEIRGGKTEGLAEWYTRLTGKDISTLTRADAWGLADKILFDRAFNDPLDQIAPDTDLDFVSRFFTGEYSLEQTGVSDAERLAFAEALVTLSRRQAGDLDAASSVTVKLRNLNVKLSIDAQTRKLTAQLPLNGADRPVRCPQDLDNLLQLAENDIFAHAKTYAETAQGREKLLAFLVPEDGIAANISRARDGYLRVIAALTGKAPVEFAGVGTKNLRDRAVGLITGTITKEQVHGTDVTERYNSQEVVELSEAYMNDVEGRSLIAWAKPVTVATAPEAREGVKPTPETIRDFAADLIMNKNTWVFDVNQAANPDKRLADVVKGYAPEVRYLLDHGEALAALDDAVRDTVRAFLDQLAACVPDIRQPGALEKRDFSNAEAMALREIVDGALDTAMSNLQRQVSALFVAEQGAGEQPLWKKTAAELNGTGGLDVSTANGRFITEVLNNYFQRAAAVDKRAMLSAYIRNTDPADSAGKKAGELIKGAGPLLQKMLQGLPVESFPEETRKALEDTRYNLAPIPPEVVNARLLNMIRNSKGYITGIKVEKSLGAASVGQAFLCRVYTKDRPRAGEEVVIKILRPNVETAIQREYALMKGIAQHVGNGMETSLENRYASVLKEFDFTLEADNIDRGFSVYDHSSAGPAAVVMQSVERYGNTVPTTGTLALKKAGGVSFASYARNVQNELRELLEKHRVPMQFGPNGVERTVYEVKDSLDTLKTTQKRLVELHEEVMKRRVQMQKVTEVWFNQAFLGGFIHGDMHSGNIMTDETGGPTLIDFGNALRMKEADRNALFVAMSVCLFAEGTNPDDPGKLFIECIRNLTTSPEDKARLAQAQSDNTIKKEMAVVLKRGDKTDVTTRLLSALTILQKHDCPVPESMTVFIQSLARLRASLSEIDALLDEIESVSEELCPAADLVERQQTRDPLLQPFEVFDRIDRARVLLAYPKGSPSFKNDAMAEVLKIFDRNGDDSFDAQRLAWDFADRIVESQDFKLEGRNGEPNKAFVEAIFERYGEGVRERAEDVFRTLDENWKDADGERRKRKMQYVLRVCLGAVLSGIKDQIDDRDVIVQSYRNVSKSFEECAYSALMDLFSSSKKDIDAVKVVQTYLGTGGGLKFGALLKANMKAIQAQMTQVEEKRQAVERTSADPKTPEKYVDTRTRIALEEVAMNVLLPPDGLTARNLRETVALNLAHIAKALNRRMLSDAECRYFAEMVELVAWKPDLGLITSSFPSPFAGLSKNGQAAFITELRRQSAENGDPIQG